MKRVIITSKKFVGEIYLVYGEDLKLLQLDFSNAQLDAAQVHYLKERVPALLFAEIGSCFSPKAELEFMLEDFEITFEMFWNKYQKKINQERCKVLWKKLSAGDMQKAFAGVDAYNRHLATETWKSKADPETYLKKKYWNNEWQ